MAQDSATGQTAGRLARLAMLESYWHSLRADGALPRRTDIDPARIEAALPCTFVAERLAPGLAQIRVAGQEVSALLGQEARGLPLSMLFDYRSRDPLAGWMEQVFALPALVSTPVAAPWSLGRSHLMGQMLLLPLADQTGQATRVMGAIILHGETGGRPRLLKLADPGMVRIENVGQMRAPVPVLRDHAAAVPAARPDQPPPRVVAGRGHLRLVVSN
jgi:hypothetical protein